MAQAVAQHYITEEEYWEQEERSVIKHEYFNGEIFAMAGASTPHNVLAFNAMLSLGNQLRGTSCRPFGSDQRLKIEATGLQVYPDLAVYCRPWRTDPNHKDTLLNPTVLIEVLSPSTAAYDQGAKFDHYKQLPSLSEYLLMWQDRVRVDCYRRLENGDWLLHTANILEESIALESINCALPLSELYEDVELPDTPRPLREPSPETEQ